MQTFGIPSADHKTAGEFVDYDYLVILNDIVVVALEDVVRFQCLLDMVVQLCVTVVGKVFYIEKPFGFSRAAFRYLHRFILDIDGEIFVAFKVSYEPVHVYIKLRRLFARAGNYKRRSRLVDKNGVHFVDDGKIEPALDHFGKALFEIIP